MNIPNPRASTSRVITWSSLRAIGSAFGALLAVAALPAGDEAIGAFAGQTDIGAPKRAGTATYEKATGDYVVQGGGGNMWFKSDSFHYVWQKVSGDVAIDAEISFPQAGGNNHRKGILMIRQSLDTDSAYIDVAVHGDGLTSLQYRETQGDITHEVQATIKAPQRVRLEKIGDYSYLSVAGEKASLTPAGSSARVVFKAPFYIGVGVCAHDDAALETVRFHNVGLPTPSTAVTAIRSTLEYVKVPSGDRVCVYPSHELIASAGWAADGSLLFAQDSKAFRVAVSGGVAETAAAAPLPVLPTGRSPDGKWQAAFEHQGGEAVLTLRPAAGGDARVLMRLPDQADAPVAIAWSPDSTKIAYVRAALR